MIVHSPSLEGSFSDGDGSTADRPPMHSGTADGGAGLSAPAPGADSPILVTSRLPTPPVDVQMRLQSPAQGDAASPVAASSGHQHGDSIESGAAALIGLSAHTSLSGTHAAPSAPAASAFGTLPAAAPLQHLQHIAASSGTTSNSPADGGATARLGPVDMPPASSMASGPPGAMSSSSAAPAAPPAAPPAARASAREVLDAAIAAVGAGSRVHGRAAARPSAKDSTVYGLSPSSPQRFYGHHTAAISAAIVFADAVTVVNEAARIQHSRHHAPGLNARP